jgi:hypothetical protein
MRRNTLRLPCCVRNRAARDAFASSYQRRDAAEHILNHEFRHRFDVAGAANRKVNCARLIAYHHSLRTGSGSHERSDETGASRQCVPLTDRQHDRQPAPIVFGGGKHEDIAFAALLLALGRLQVEVVDVTAIGCSSH